MKKIILHPSGKEIPYSEDQTVLATLEKSGYALPNNCRAGACGECKVKILSGEIDQGFILDMALPQSERDEGYGLMCMAKIKSESLEIEWGTEDAKPILFPPKDNMRFIVTSKQDATPSIAKLTLRSLGAPMKFWPGQYITIQDTENTVDKRAYSIANIPNDTGEVKLHVTKVKGGKTSSWIHESIKEGDTVKVSGPFGAFIGDPSQDNPVLCLAAGSGLAPICSLANAALLRGGFKNKATILFSASTKKDVYEVGNFSYLEKKFRNFKFKYTLTQEENPNGLQGRIPELLSELYPDLSKTSLYIAGSVGFVESCIKKAKALGAKDENIHSEGFSDQSIKTK